MESACPGPNSRWFNQVKDSTEQNLERGLEEFRARAQNFKSIHTQGSSCQSSQQQPLLPHERRLPVRVENRGKR
jgi:hypothetical protein